MTNYLITGANRGIGRGLTDLILARPNTTVIALVRDLEHETTKSLASSHANTRSKLVILPYDAAQSDSAASAIAALQTTHGIPHLDTVVANAGMLSWRGPAVDTPAAAIHDAVTVNMVGPLSLFHACLPLLRKASHTDTDIDTTTVQTSSNSNSSSTSSGTSATTTTPKFIAISSAIGSTTLIPQLSASQTLAYGISKAALNHTMRRLSIDHTDIVVELMTPGPVRTDLTRDYDDFLKEALARNPQFADRFIPIDKVCRGLLSLIDGASLGVDGTTGGFRDWKGEIVPW